MDKDAENESKNLHNPSEGISAVFEKRAGTTDRGRDYEHLYVANLILKLVLDDAVEDFYLSSNDKEFGSFDDVVVTVKYCSKNETETYAIQLKQSRNKVLRSRDLRAARGLFSIREYLEDYYKNIKPTRNWIKLVLLTNCKSQIDEHLIIEVDGEEIGVKICWVQGDDLLSTYKSRSCCHLLPSVPRYEDFFQNFYLYAGQADVDHIEALTSKLFTDVFGCDSSTFDNFVNFVAKWSVKGTSKEKLCRSWMQQAIALCILSPYIKPLSFLEIGKSCTKENLFRISISKFQLTTLRRDCFERIKNLWGTVIPGLDLDKVNKTRLKYQIGLKHVRSVDDLIRDDKETTKLLWLLGKCPLAVEDSQGIYEAAKLCKNLTFIVLTSDIQLNESFPCFQNLSHLRPHGELYEGVLSNFTYSLEHQQASDLKLLVQAHEELDVLVTTESLVRMLEGPLPIGRREELLPPCHISRSLCKILIDPNFLKHSNALFILATGVSDYKLFGMLHSYLQIIELESGVELNFPKRSNTNMVCVTRDEYSQEQFYGLCSQKTRRRRCYQFRNISSEYMEWTRSYSVQEMGQFRLDHEYVHGTLSETDLFDKSENTINIICANSGMGKSTLMKSLKASSSSAIWSLVICVRNHSFCYRQKLQVDAFLDYIWAYNCKRYDDRDKQIFKALMDRGKMRIIWDGLDEVPKEILDNILTLIKDISKRGITQWVTARNNLRTVLEDKLQTFARRIKEFDAEEQREYIKRRLDFSHDDLFALFKKIKTNIQPFSNHDILGIPLQVYMLTELLVRDRDKYTKLLDQSFSILDLYENFVLEKFNLYYEEKMKLDLRIGNNYQKCREEMKQRIECYKRVAFTTYFKKGILNYFSDTSDDFLEAIKDSGDPVGFISNVTNGVPEFVHSSFSEYFTALYLFDCDPYKAKDHKFVTNDELSNIRFFLDLLLAEDSKAHLAILYKNSLLLDQCSELELNRLDKINRSVLELSCCWSHKYEIAKIQRIGFGRFNIHTKYPVGNDDVKRLQYTHDFTRIGPVDVRVRKILLLLPFLIPQYITCVDDECAALLIYYSVIFDHVTILKYMNNILWLKKAYDNFEPEYLLSVALIYESHKVLQELILREEYCESLRGNLNLLLYTCRFGIDGIFSLLSKHVIDVNELIFFACSEGRVENVRFLVDKGVRTDLPNGDGCLPIHCACNNEVDGFRIVEFLILRNEDVNVQDRRKRLPLHYACMNTRFGTRLVTLLNTKRPYARDIYHRTPLHYACDNEEHGFAIAEFLLTGSVELNTPDVHQRTPLYYACMNWKFGVHILSLLLANGANFNTLDCKGRTPLHYACKNYHRGFDMVTVMLEMGADPNLVDGDGRAPIQYACESGKLETASLLIDKLTGRRSTLLHDACKNYSHGYGICRLLIHKGFSVNLQDENHRTPLHNACKFGKPETVQLLLKSGASTHVQDDKKRLPFHYACMNIYHSAQIVRLLIDSYSRIGVLDIYNRLPIHYACKKANIYTISLLVGKNSTQICIPDSHGRLPIHYACYNYNNGYEIIKLLVNKGAGVNVGDRDGRMPIHHACEAGSIYIVSLLLEIGTRLDVRDSSNRTPLDYAQEAGNYNVVQLLTGEYDAHPMK